MKASFLLNLARSFFSFCRSLADKAHNAALDAAEKLQAEQFKLAQEINALEAKIDGHHSLAAEAHDFKTKIAGLLGNDNPTNTPTANDGAGVSSQAS